MGNLTDKRKTTVVEEMRELGYGECNEKLVQDVYDWHRANPLPHNAALAANILTSLDAKGVSIIPENKK